ESDYSPACNLVASCVTRMWVTDTRVPGVDVAPVATEGPRAEPRVTVACGRVPACAGTIGCDVFGGLTFFLTFRRRFCAFERLKKGPVMAGGKAPLLLEAFEHNRKTRAGR